MTSIFEINSDYFFRGVEEKFWVFVNNKSKFGVLAES